MGEEDLRQFLKAWLEWAEAGGKNEGPFYRSEGLCNTSHNWAIFNKFSSVRRHALYESLSVALPKHGPYPFGGLLLYTRERIDEKIHLNQERLAWVRRQLCQTN